jgi:quercetin dioxygenase-like cupin family protein
MRLQHAVQVAEVAVAGKPERPATAIVHDCADARVVVFRIEPGQEVPAHSSTSTVLLTVIAGSGTISGQVEGTMAEQLAVAGDFVSFEAGEPHGMRGGTSAFVVMATIAPRPGAPKLPPT